MSKKSFAVLGLGLLFLIPAVGLAQTVCNVSLNNLQISPAIASGPGGAQEVYRDNNYSLSWNWGLATDRPTNTRFRARLIPTGKTDSIMSWTFTAARAQTGTNQWRTTFTLYGDRLSKGMYPDGYYKIKIEKIESGAVGCAELANNFYLNTPGATSPSAPKISNLQITKNNGTLPETIVNYGDGPSLYRGTSYRLTWQSTNLRSSEKLKLSAVEDGTPNKTVLSSSINNTGSYEFVFPSSLATSKGYRFLLEFADSGRENIGYSGTASNVSPKFYLWSSPAIPVGIGTEGTDQIAQPKITISSVGDWTAGTAKSLVIKAKNLNGHKLLPRLCFFPSNTTAESYYREYCSNIVITKDADAPLLTSNNQTKTISATIPASTTAGKYYIRVYDTSSFYDNYRKSRVFGDSNNFNVKASVTPANTNKLRLGGTISSDKKSVLAQVNYVRDGLPQRLSAAYLKIDYPEDKLTFNTTSSKNGCVSGVLETLIVTENNNDNDNNNDNKVLYALCKNMNINFYTGTSRLVNLEFTVNKDERPISLFFTGPLNQTTGNALFDGNSAYLTLLGADGIVLGDTNPSITNPANPPAETKDQLTLTATTVSDATKNKGTATIIVSFKNNDPVNSKDVTGIQLRFINLTSLLEDPSQAKVDTRFPSPFTHAFTQDRLMYSSSGRILVEPATTTVLLTITGLAKTPPPPSLEIDTRDYTGQIDADDFTTGVFYQHGNDISRVDVPSSIEIRTAPQLGTGAGVVAPTITKIDLSLSKPWLIGNSQNITVNATNKVVVYLCDARDTNCGTTYQRANLTSLDGVSAGIIELKLPKAGNQSETWANCGKSYFLKVEDITNKTFATSSNFTIIRPNNAKCSDIAPGMLITTSGWYYADPSGRKVGDTCDLAIYHNGSSQLFNGRKFDLHLIPCANEATSTCKAYAIPNVSTIKLKSKIEIAFADGHQQIISCKLTPEDATIKIPNGRYLMRLFSLASLSQPVLKLDAQRTFYISTKSAWGSVTNQLANVWNSLRQLFGWLGVR